MKVTIFEGTPEEIAKAFPNLAGASQVSITEADSHRPIPSMAAPNPSVGQGDTLFVTTDMARLVLKRRRLSPEMHIVLRALYEAYPSSVASEDLRDATGYDGAQFRGMMGAFGRRLSHTDGYVEGSWFFDQDWDYDEGAYEYSLPETVREALELEGLV